MKLTTCDTFHSRLLFGDCSWGRPVTQPLSNVTVLERKLRKALSPAEALSLPGFWHQDFQQVTLTRKLRDKNTAGGVTGMHCRKLRH